VPSDSLALVDDVNPDFVFKLDALLRQFEFQGALVDDLSESRPS